jgi:hypothetical protein
MHAIVKLHAGVGRILRTSTPSSFFFFVVVRPVPCKEKVGRGWFKFFFSLNRIKKITNYVYQIFQSWSIEKEVNFEADYKAAYCKSYVI